MKFKKLKKVTYQPAADTQFVLEDDDMLWQRVGEHWQIIATRWWGSGKGSWRFLKSGTISYLPWGAASTAFKELTYPECFYELL